VEGVKIAFVLAICAPACGCTRYKVDFNAKDRITVCGRVQQQDGAPVSKAVIELHKLAKDTSDDIVTNSYEHTKTDASGSFVLRSPDEGRQYCLSINGTRSCERLSMSELESKRLSVIFRRSEVEGDCESKINLSLDSSCDLKLL
jgi:hypothetical protein